MSYVDLDSKTRVRILCEFGDSAHCGAAVFCKAEKTVIPGKLPHPRGIGQVDNPSVARLCTTDPGQCPSRESFIENGGLTQQDEAARARRAHEIQEDQDNEVLEQFTLPTRRRK